MNQYINDSDNLIRHNESIFQPTEFYQFNTVDNNFMNSNDFFILQPEPDNNLILPISLPADTLTNIDGIKNKRPSKKTTSSPSVENILIKPKKNYPCDLCNNVFEDTITLRKHKRSYHNNLSKIYKCPKCTDSFNFENNYKIHLYSHLKTTNQCPECLQNFKRTTIFHKHLKIHQNNDCFQCDKCKMEFEFKEYYDWHLNETNKNRNCNVFNNLVKKKKISSESDKKNITNRHVCQICGKKFQKPFFLRRHENIHFNIKPFECGLCSAKFNQKNSLDRHQLTHTKEKPYECPKCNMRFSQRPNLILHDKNVHSSSPSDTTKHPCPNCTCIFNKKNSLNRHISEKHKILPFNDDYNNSSVENVMEQLNFFLNQQNCQNNENNNNENNDNIVEGSGGADVLQSNLQDNVITLEQPQPLPEKHPNNNNNNIITENIEEIKDNNKMFTKLVKIIDTLNPKKEIKYKIVKQIIENGNKWFGCNVCEKKFKRCYDLLRHLTIHTKERAFICGICSRAFSIKNSLKCHMKIHSQQSHEKIFDCTICLLRFRSLTQLNNHISTHGSNLNFFFCQLCNKSFRTSHNLRVHQLQVHRPKYPKYENIVKTLIPPIKLENYDDNDVKKELEKIDDRFQCLICGVLLKSKSHLRFHENQHLNLKTFECIICNKKFSTKGSLNVHRKIHFTVKSLNCQLCPRKFRNASDLKRHGIVHSTERKFLCPYCSKMFKTKTTCTAHIKIHAKEQLENNNKNEITENKSNLLDNFPEDKETNIIQEDENEYSLLLRNEDINLNIPIEEVINLNNYSELPSENDDFFYDHNENDGNSSTNLLFINNSNIPQQIQSSSNIELCTENSSTTIMNAINITESVPNELLHKEQFIDLQDIQKTQNNRLKSNFIVESIEKELVESQDTQNSIPFNVKIMKTKKKIFPCEYCKKIFKKPIDYRRHIKTHTKEKPFVCKLCNKSFTLKCTLNDHLKTHDDNRQTYNCIVCNKKYATKSVLNTHIRLHTGEMPYQCDICLKKFRTIGHRNAHVCQKW